MPGPVCQYTFNTRAKELNKNAQKYDRIYSVLEKVLASPDES